MAGTENAEIALQRFQVAIRTKGLKLQPGVVRLQIHSCLIDIPYMAGWRQHNSLNSFCSLQEVRLVLGDSHTAF